MTLPPIAIERRVPWLGENPDYSKVFYFDPPSHDFCTWLIIAEVMRRYHKAPAPLQVRFGFMGGQLGLVDFGPNGLLSKIYSECGVSREYHETMLANVLRPAIKMIGGVELPPLHAPFPLEEIADHCEYDYHIGHLVDAVKQGYTVPHWNPPQWAHDEVDEFLTAKFGGEPPVILTLREVDRQPERNSRVGEWVKFGHMIRSAYPVLFLRDTALADVPLPPFVTWPRASTNSYVRAALYQRALVNMMVGTGPNTWCCFSDAPYLFFKQLIPELPEWAHGRPDGWYDQAHMHVGDHYPWATPLQRMTWTTDTFINLASAFADLMDRKAAMSA